jgi:ABC-type nitrate/sulfonate/bicarbonate transport system permease component
MSASSRALLPRIAWRLWLPLALLAVWQWLASIGLLNALFFPAPTRVAVSAWKMVQSGELRLALSVTFSRMILGASIGVATGLLTGLAMGVLSPVRKSLEPLVSALNSTPKLALMPMLLIFTGIGETARLVPIALTAFIVVAVNTLDAVRGINIAHIELARNYGATGWTMLRHVYLPASLPQFFTGVRLALGRSLVITISVELLGASDGLGSMLWMAWQTFATERLYVGIAVTALTGVLVHEGLHRAEIRLLPWREQPRSS